MAERFLSARQARLNPPFSLVNSYLLRIGPQAVQGAKRRSGPLTARTDPGSSRERERGELRGRESTTGQLHKGTFYATIRLRGRAIRSVDDRERLPFAVRCVVRERRPRQDVLVDVMPVVLR